MDGGCDHSRACLGAWDQKMQISDENVEGVVEVNWPVSQGWMQERIGEEITDITTNSDSKGNCRGDPADPTRIKAHSWR